MKNSFFVLGKNDVADRKDVAVDVGKLVDTRMLVQANSGGGKSWLLRRLAEATCGTVQTIILDPEGEFVTLREVADVLIVGKEGDVPADPRSAGLLARRLLELGVSAVVDLYDLKVQQRKAFVRYFLESLMTLPKELWHPAFIILDEAHLFCPEAAHGEAESTQAVIDLCSQGRKRGYCAVLATQRLSKLQKDAAAELNNVCIGRTTLDVDMKRAADILGWNGQQRQTLRSIPPGWFQYFGPAFVREETGCVKVGDVKSSHPKAGKRHAIKPPKPSAALAKVLQELTDLPQQAEAEIKDLAAAKKKIRELETELKAKPKPVEIPEDPKKVQRAIERAVDAATREAHTKFDELTKIAGRVYTAATMIAKLTETLPTIEKPYSTVGFILSPVPMKHESGPNVGKQIPIDGDTKLGKGPTTILKAIAQSAPTPVTDAEITILTGYKSTSKYEYLKQLRAAGCIINHANGYLATEEGVIYLGDDFERLPTGGELRKYWLEGNKLEGGPKKILGVLCEQYSDVLTNDQIEQATGYKSTSRYEYVKKLRALRLIDDVDGGIKASDKLFD